MRPTRTGDIVQPSGMQFDKKRPPLAQRITRTELVRGEAGSAGTDQAQLCGPLPGAPQGGPSPKNMSNNVDESMTNNFESDTLSFSPLIPKVIGTLTPHNGQNQAGHYRSSGE